MKKLTLVMLNIIWLIGVCAAIIAIIAIIILASLMNKTEATAPANIGMLRQAKAVANSAPIDISINGTVYILTKGGATIRFPMAPIILLSSAQIDEMKNFVAQRVAEQKVEADKMWDAAQANFDQIEKATEKQKAKRILEGIDQQQLVLEYLALKPVATHTDINGRFHVTSKTGYWILSTATRQIYDKTETYIWMFPTNKSGEIELNNNCCFNG